MEHSLIIDDYDNEEKKTTTMMMNGLAFDSGCYSTIQHE